MFCEGLLEVRYETKEDLRQKFLDYIEREIRPHNNRKAGRILEIANSIDCFTPLKI